MGRSVFLFTLVLLLTSVCGGSLWAQNGTLRGLVTETLNGKEEPLPFTNIQLLGTALGASSAIDGTFEISVPAGTYSIILSHVGYFQDTVTNVTIKAGQTTDFNHSLKPSVQNMDEVVVAERRISNTEMSLMSDIRKSTVLVSGLTEQQIKQNQDRNAADVARRIPGVTIMEDRFVFVRGLSERYNRVLIGNIGAPSMETDKKAFSFNMLSSGILERMLIYKSGSPELPGDFSGGLVKVITRSTVDGPSVKLDYSISYRAGTTFEISNKGISSPTDFIGTDNGTRGLPKDLALDLSAIQSANILEREGKKLNNNWGITEKMAIPDQQFRVTYADNFKLGKTNVSAVNSLGYSFSSRSFQAENFSYLNFDSIQQVSERIYGYNDASRNENTRVGLLSNWGFDIAANHRIDFQNTFDQLGQDQTMVRTGIHDFEGKEDRNYAFRYRSNSVYNGQLGGKHKFKGQLWNYEWTFGYSYAGRSEPDFRKVRFRRDIGTDDPYAAVIPPGASTFDAGRFYGDLKEHVISVRQHADWLALSDSIAEVSVFGGAFYERKDRSFDARWMSYTVANFSTFDQNLLTLPVGEIFNAQNVNASSGFELAEGTNLSDAYTASNDLMAAYLGTEADILEVFKVRGGVRFEYNVQQLESGQNLLPINVSIPLLSVLPSINMSVKPTKKMQVRITYFRSVNRPEFRELAPFTYYDFELNNTIAGNTNLKVPDIHNADLGWEFFGQGTDNIRIGGFYKYFFNPIETVFEAAGGGGTNSFRFANAVSAFSTGAELEGRISLAHLGDVKFIRDLGLMGNFTYIYSEVDLGNVAGQDRKRPMMGQASYILNAGIFYQNEKSGLSVNVLYNMVGPRLFAAGSAFNPDIYEMPRPMLDLNISQRLAKKVELYLSAKNLINTRFSLGQDSDRNGKLNEVDEPIFRYRDGQYLTLGIKVNL
jgi:outer membrane receptor for ferrienterochelin and colicin